MTRACSTHELFEGLAAWVDERVGEFDRVPTRRREILEGLARLVDDELAADRTARLTFICTHNSRRSHFAQIWAQTAAHVYGTSHIETFSGGTEVTAFNPRAVAAVRRAGFGVERGTAAENPVYRVTFSNRAQTMECFSKVIDEAPNPSEDFIAVMTCSAADAACPVVSGASGRVALPYDDPKASDGAERERQTYDERCREIAREMLFLFSRTEAG